MRTFFVDPFHGEFLFGAELTDGPHLILQPVNEDFGSDVRYEYFPAVTIEISIFWKL